MSRQKSRARARAQQRLRKQRGERAFLFDADLTNCLGSADRDEWECAVSLFGGNVADAARLCGIDGIPRGAKALWGTSAEGALATYRKWQNRSKPK